MLLAMLTFSRNLIFLALFADILMFMQVHLIEGVIDQVESRVYVSWVQPRVLGILQIKSLGNRLDNWINKVHTTLLAVEAETPDLMAS